MFLSLAAEAIPSTKDKILASISGGKDSTAALHKALEYFPPEQVIAHHQIIVEDWPGTLEYCQKLCEKVGVPLYTAQAKYYGYECDICQERYLSIVDSKACKKCRKASGLRQVAVVECLLDLMYWREAWPSNSIRFCTSYLKRDVLNQWVIRHRDLLGHRPVLVLGERWLESNTRAKLPYLKERHGVDCARDDFSMQEWHPILAYRRVDSFYAGQLLGVEPHYCYKLQGMTDADFLLDVEGGPRMSCRCCFYKSPEELLIAARIPGNEVLFDALEVFEAKTGYFIRQGLSIAMIRRGEFIPDMIAAAKSTAAYCS